MAAIFRYITYMLWSQAQAARGLIILVSKNLPGSKTSHYMVSRVKATWVSVQLMTEQCANQQQSSRY